jgi:hypothetical protein
MATLAGVTTFAAAAAACVAGVSALSDCVVGVPEELQPVRPGIMMPANPTVMIATADTDALARGCKRIGFFMV